MADAFLIETASINPYENIVSDTTNQMNSVQTDIQKVSNAISNLERANPTHYLLPKLRERLSELQTKAKNLWNTNESAKSLLTSYNDSLANSNTMEWLYRLKQSELNRAQQEADRTYRQMSEDVRRSWENYINALWNATASENAIINANAWNAWASQQSTAEARARNYLQNSQAQAEANANMISNLNAINDSRLNSNAWYVQLSQWNADNTLRQQIMNNYDAQQNAVKYWYWSWSWSWWSRVTLPNTVKKNNPWWWQTVDDMTNSITQEATSPQWYQDTEQDKKIKEDAARIEMEIANWVYWQAIWNMWMYHNNINWKVTDSISSDNTVAPKRSPFMDFLDSWYSDSSSKLIVDLDRNKTNKFLKDWNDKWDLGSTFVQPTDKWYLLFIDGNNNRKVAFAKDLMEWNPDKITVAKKNGNVIIR